jgi:O-antigen/teichoic acid export membrane protein
MTAEPAAERTDDGSIAELNGDPLVRAAGHGMWAMAALLVPGLYSLFLIAYLLRVLGPEGYAPWATTVALLGWLLLLDAGLSATTTREAARAVSGEGTAADRVMTANVAYGLLGAGGMVLGVVLCLLTPVILGLTGVNAIDAWLVGVFLSLDTALVIGTSGWTGTARGARRFDLLLLSNVVQVAVAIAVLVALLPLLGLVGAAIAQPVGRAFGRGTLALVLHRLLPWFVTRPSWPGLSRLLALGAFSLPILAIQAANQLGIGADVIVVGAFSGATAAGLYAAGSQFVRYVAMFVMPAIGVVLPAFSAAAYNRVEATPGILVRTLACVGLIAGTVFGGMALEAEQALNLWIGAADPLAVAVMRLYALTFAAIVPAYVMILMLIARDQHRVVGLVVLVEAVLNLVLSLLLIRLIGPIGVALSTLAVVAVDDILVIPVITARALGMHLGTVLVPALGGLAAGAGIVLVTQLVPLPGPEGSMIRGALAFTLMLVGLIVLIRSNLLRLGRA